VALKRETVLNELRKLMWEQTNDCAGDDEDQE
jgi:hypothetical protein